MTTKRMGTLLCTIIFSTTLVAQVPGRNLNAYEKAVKGNDIKTVKSYVNDPAFGANVKFSDGSTPLHWSAYAGQNTMTKYLLKHGASANAQTSTGTPLHWSVNNGKHDTTKTLIDHGKADPNAKITNSGLTPLHWQLAQEKNHVKGSLSIYSSEMLPSTYSTSKAIQQPIMLPVKATKIC